MTRAGEPADPTRDYLHWRHFEKLPDGSEVDTPMSLEQVEQVWRRAVDRDGEERVRLCLENSEEEGRESPVVAITSGKGALLMSALSELALRLRPGLAVGPMQSGESIGELLRTVEWQLETGS